MARVPRLIQQWHNKDLTDQTGRIPTACVEAGRGRKEEGAGRRVEDDGEGGRMGGSQQLARRRQGGGEKRGRGREEVGG